MCFHQRVHNNNTVKVRKVAPPLGETPIHNSRDAVTVSAAVATRSRADRSSMEGHTSLSTAVVLWQWLICWIPVCSGVGRGATGTIPP